MKHFQLLLVLVNFLYIVNVYAINSDLLPSSDICGVSQKGETPEDQVVVADLDEFPWLALLQYERETGLGFLCGGVLINNRYVLTGAVCAQERPNMKLISVRLGETNTDTNPDCAQNGATCAGPVLDVPIAETIIHEDYNSRTHLNDIALLRLERPIEFTESVKPICLATSDNLLHQNYSGTNMILSGWGKTSDRDTINEKLKLRVPVTSNDHCANIYEEVKITIASSHICAGGVKDIDLCRGSSGTSLMTKQEDGGNSNWYAAGIVSFGTSECGKENWPTVYTRVSEYVPWIISKLQA